MTWLLKCALFRSTAIIMKDFKWHSVPCSSFNSSFCISFSIAAEGKLLNDTEKYPSTAVIYTQV